MFDGNLIRPLLIGSALLFSLPLTACATAGSGQAALSTPMPVSRIAATPPAGFKEFCARMPSHCAGARTAKDVAAVTEPGPGPRFERIAYAAQPARFNWGPVFADLQPAVATPPAADAGRPQVSMTPALWSQLEATNQKINDLIRPTDDVAAFGVADYWALPITEGLTRVGNCKHYALEKREALIASGLPSSALTVAVALTRSGEPHAVLVVATDRGDFILDNLSPWVTPWQQTGYTWIERQVPEDPSRWVMLSENRTDIAFLR